jgi:integrase
MPKLNSRPPKYSKLKNYAVVYVYGKIHYLGLYGSPESKVAYSRFGSENQASPAVFLPTGETSVTIKELAAAFLDHAKAHYDTTTYDFYRIIVFDFLLKLYGDGTLADEFKPRCLKLVRAEMVQSRRFCRGTINEYTRRIATVFLWGVGEEYVTSETADSLKAVKPLPADYPDTFDNDEREDVPDDVIRRTLPFVPPMLAAMRQVQRMTGCGPSEIFNMKAGEIDKKSDPDLWLYRLPRHKTEKKTKRKKVVPLGKPEQELIAPYLEGKTGKAAVFSPQTAMQERSAEKRAKRKSKLTPSQVARDEAQSQKETKYREFYDKDSYRRAVKHAIVKANRQLPDDEQIPHWLPYQLRHTAATMLELEADIEDAQILLDHESVDTTKRYTKKRLEKSKKLARNRRNPLADDKPSETQET